LNETNKALLAKENKKKLRVAHLPQVPCKPFHVEVETIEEAKKIFDVLANYDLFQFHNRIKPDYCNATFLQTYNEEEGEWLDWDDDEYGMSEPDEYLAFLEEDE